jgi:hypothetical protein
MFTTNAAAGAAHRLQRQLPREHRRAQIEVERRAPLRRRRGGEVRRSEPAAGVVDEHAQAVRFRDERLDVGRHQHVGAPEPRPVRPDPRDGLLAPTLVDVRHDDARALGGQPLGDRAAGADRGAGDDRLRAREVHAPKYGVATRCGPAPSCRYR